MLLSLKDYRIPGEDLCGIYYENLHKECSMSHRDSETSLSLTDQQKNNKK